MTEPHPPRIGALLEDWVTIWQSELASLATDPEMQEALQRLIDAWATQARLVARAAGAVIDAAGGPSPGGARPAPAPGTPPAGAAADGCDPRVATLLDRIDALERRLARLERG